MTLDQLIEFINKEDQRLRNYYGNPSKERRILSRTVKLMEENGELANEILASISDQRNSKLKNRNLQNLSEEFADVIITSLLLARSANVDIKEALIRKINKINKRDYSK